jgi:rhodanese-related sulfurtransferase
MKSIPVKTLILLTLLGTVLFSGQTVFGESESITNLTPVEAYRFLAENEKSVLIDVRSRAGYYFIGHPPKAHNIPLEFWNAMEYDFEPNPDFSDDLSSKFDKDVPILFLCRGGKKSVEASEMALDMGFKVVANVLQGFEGEEDNDGRRTVNGWKNAGLPYTFDVEEKLMYKEKE